MDDDQRSQIRDNARYLRNVRPIDPEEIHEYVEGLPHPAAVRQVLREEATTLGLLEREDGRFEPVPDEPVSVSPGEITTVPEDISRGIEDLLVERFGPGWPDGESGAHLRSGIRSFKRSYLRGESVTYDEVTALGYALYHLPSYFATIQYALAELTADGLLPRHARVLDVGAGVGGPALGIDSLYPAGALVEYHAVEPSAGADVLERLLAETGPNFHPTVYRERIESFEPTGEYDLLVFANVLSELDNPAGTVQRLLESLAPDGTVVAIAPADRNTAIGLREVERTVEREAGVTVYAPTVRLWPHETPGCDSWSFVRKPDLAVPGFQRRLDEGERSETESLREEGADEEDPEPRTPGDGEFVNVDVQYAYSLLRADERRALEFRPDPRRVAKMADTGEHVTDRVDYVAVKLSHDLSTEGNPLFLLGDGSQKRDHFAVLTESSMLNDDLTLADYGSLLQFENVLVLWNDDEQAYNLVVDGETLVERIPV